MEGRAEGASWDANVFDRDALHLKIQSIAVKVNSNITLIHEMYNDSISQCTSTRFQNFK